MKTRVFAVAAALCFTLLVGRAIGQREQTGKPEAETPAGQERQPTPEERMAELGTPGPEHAAMQPLVGNWACDLSFTRNPGDPPNQSSGTMKREMIMDGRYLSEQFEGTIMDQPFRGQGTLGFDRGQKQYESVWIDSMSTRIYFQTGKGEAGGKKITFEGENFDPMEGKKRWAKSTREIVSNDKQVMKMWKRGPDGKEFQTFEMTCTRK